MKCLNYKKYVLCRYPDAREIHYLGLIHIQALDCIIGRIIDLSEKKTTLFKAWKQAYHYVKDGGYGYSIDDMRIFVRKLFPHAIAFKNFTYLYWQIRSAPYLDDLMQISLGCNDTEEKAWNDAVVFVNSVIALSEKKH